MWSNFPLFPEQASTVAGRVDALYYFLVAISVFFTVLITGVMLYFAIKYRRRSDFERPRPVEGSLALETVWAVIPFGLTMIMFGWGASIFFTISNPPDNAIELYAIGKQWMWKFQHPNGQREINELHVPVGRAIKLTMMSQDVIHDLYVPAFRVKADVLPGRYTTLWFQATKPGKYHLFCAEYCGTQHAGMIGQVVVMEPAQYQAWLNEGILEEVPALGEGVPSAGATEKPPAPVEETGTGSKPSPTEGSLVVEGEALFQDMGCNACHKMDAPGRGPNLKDVYGKPVQLQSGETVTADENYLRESILQPQAKIVAGFRPLMPPYEGRVSEEDLLRLIEYIKFLGKE
ncbi:MAG: cytochrome c oxidase subunit II [Nitrospira sp.]|nr:cytochrome c oxidase subunit II [Nitrospira sp.]